MMNKAFIKIQARCMQFFLQAISLLLISACTPQQDASTENTKTDSTAKKELPPGYSQKRDTSFALIDTVSPMFNIHLALRRSDADSFFLSINGRVDSFVWPPGAYFPMEGTILTMRDTNESFSNFMVLNDTLLLISLVDYNVRDYTANWFLYRMCGKGPMFIKGGEANVPFVCWQPDRQRILAFSHMTQEDAQAPFYRMIKIYSLETGKFTEERIYGDDRIHLEDKPDYIKFYKSIK